jgi:Mg2+ and Co2+ transporter CorA
MSSKSIKNIQLLLKLKKQNENFYNYLIDVINTIKEIKSSCCSNDVETNIKNLLDDYNNDIDSIKELAKHYVKDINSLINETCIHEIEEDDIDIGENSKRIKYCKICEITFV